MKLLRGLHNPGIGGEGCVATIGNFDGVHLGHQYLIAQLREQAQRLGLPLVVVVFEPQPLEFFRGAGAPARVLSFRDKYEALKACGVDQVFCLRFDAALSQLSPQQFVQQVLLDHLKVKHLVVGDDFRFGGDRSGDFNYLKQVGAEHGFSVENTPTQCDPNGDERVSSTRLRSALLEGDFDTVERLMGRAFVIKGAVLHGQKLGRTIGFATANLALKRKVAPLRGVYAVRITLADGVEHNAVANIGVKPTVGDFRANLEVHIFDFSGDIYGQRVSVRFIAKIRDEQKFAGLDALQAQIKQDAQAARALLA